MNLLRSEQSNLTFDQWNNLSNVVSRFDQYSGLRLANDYLQEQMSLPPNYRFKLSSVNRFLSQLMEQVQLVFEKNRDVQSISLHDRRLLLRNTVECTTSFGCAVLFQQSQLFNQPLFVQSVENLFENTSVNFVQRLIEHLDPDIFFLKISFSLMSCFISNYTIYAHQVPTYLDNDKSIFQLEGIYAELVWRYLLHRYGHRQAVLSFSNLIRCYLLLNETVVQAHDVAQYAAIINIVVRATEEKVHNSS